MWEILTAVDSYAIWNPFVVEVDTDQSTPEKGALMDFKVRFPGDESFSTSKELVIEFDPPEEKDGTVGAKWVYDYASFPSKIGMIKATRIQTLSQEPGQPVKYFSQETFSGWGSSFVPIKKVQAGFDAQTAGLKQAAEERAKISA